MMVVASTEKKKTLNVNNGVSISQGFIICVAYYMFVCMISQEDCVKPETDVLLVLTSVIHT